MSFIFDFVFDTFLYFRLGNSASKPNRCIYSSIDAEDLNSTEESIDASYDQLPTINERRDTQITRVCMISDTHERHHVLQVPPCDILIHAGDILMTSRFASRDSARRKLSEFNAWLGRQPARHRLVIAGNHDLILERLTRAEVNAIFSNATYLCNDSALCEGLRVFGTPASHGESDNRAFQTESFWQRTEEAVKQLQVVQGESGDGNDSSSCGVDILITHGPCRRLAAAVKPRLMHVWGHIHACHGLRYVKSDGSSGGWWSVCAPLMGRKYTPVQLPIVIDIRHHHRRTAVTAAAVEDNLTWNRC